MHLSVSTDVYLTLLSSRWVEHESRIKQRYVMTVLKSQRYENVMIFRVFFSQIKRPHKKQYVLIKLGADR